MGRAIAWGSRRGFVEGGVTARSMRSVRMIECTATKCKVSVHEAPDGTEDQTYQSLLVLLLCGLRYLDHDAVACGNTAI